VNIAPISSPERPSCHVDAQQEDEKEKEAEEEKDGLQVLN